ncbi:hypothetical protein [uncultured Nisaea sp.]|tara:strand:+ start:169 stop:318 length:150 start_codon:yes stop_codon:yes gene_type:complete
MKTSKAFRRKYVFDGVRDIRCLRGYSPAGLPDGLSGRMRDFRNRQGHPA